MKNAQGLIADEPSGSLWLQKARQNDLLLVLLLIIAAAAFRGYSLQFFDVIPVDGTTYVESARKLNQGNWHGIAVSGFYSVLIAVAGRLISDLETAGKVISLLCGSLLPLPLYFLGKELFSRRVAIAAALLVIVSPVLIGSSCQVITQATYTTIQLAGLLLIWRLFHRPSLVNGWLAGIFTGLTFLTRPEGILLFLVAPLALIFYRHRALKGKWQPMAAYVSGFSLLLAVNMFLVHAVTGEWQLSAKTDSALNDALSYYLNKPDLIYVPGYKPLGYMDIILEHPEFIIKNTADNLRKLWEIVLPPWEWLLLLTGFFFGGDRQGRSMGRMFLFSSLAALPMLIVFYYITTGYTEAYLPVLYLWVAAGFDRIWMFFQEKLPPGGRSVWQERLGHFPITVAAAAIYAAVIFVPQIREPVSADNYLPQSDNFRRDEKHIGKLLKETLPPGKIMTRWARIAFYAEREWVNIPAAMAFDEVIDLARKSGVRFFIADGTLYGMRPMLGKEIFAPLYDEELPFGIYFRTEQDYLIRGLKVYMLYTNPRSMGVVVYEIDQEAV